MSEIQNPTTLEFANCIKTWWEQHKFDVTGPYGDYNVYDTEPEFVTLAKKVLGDWEAPFVVEAYRSPKDYRYKRPEPTLQRYWALEDAKTHAASPQFDAYYEVVVRRYTWTADPDGYLEYKRFQKEDEDPGTGSPDDEGWFDVIAYRTKERWDGPLSGDEGLEGFLSLDDAKTYADSDEFADFYQVVVIAYGEHENYESGEGVYDRFKRED